MLLIKKKENQEKGLSPFCGEFIKALSGNEYNVDIAIFTDISITTPHFHKGFDEIYVVIQGKIEVTTYESPSEIKKLTKLKTNELILIGKNVHHQITKASKKNNLMVICNPPFNSEDEHESEILLKI